MNSQPAPGAYSGGNLILDRLTANERLALFPALTVRLEEEGSVLQTSDAPIETVTFPIDAVYSVVVELDRGQMYEVDVIGRGGAVGAELALGAHVASRNVLCQIAGRAAQISQTHFMLALDRSRTFLSSVREALRRQWFASQQTVACNFAHTVEQRTARWLLLTQDQVACDEFLLRPEVLSIMLGLQERLIHEPLSVLARLGCIRVEGPQITVLSHRTLEEYACECYQRQRTAPFIIRDGVP